jgi:hypothetical protein
MDWLSFVASVVGSVAWPVTAVGVVFVLRRALNRLLPDLSRLKYKDLELEFGRQVAKARAEIEATPAPPQLPESTSRTVQAQPYFQTLAEVSPRAALLEAWLPFEIAASQIGERLSISQPGRPAQMPSLIEGLNREGMLTDDEARAVARLRAVRNDVVHAPAVDLSPQAVAEYASLLQDVTQALERRAKAREATSGPTRG